MILNLTQKEEWNPTYQVVQKNSIEFFDPWLEKSCFIETNWIFQQIKSYGALGTLFKGHYQLSFSFNFWIRLFLDFNEQFVCWFFLCRELFSHIWLLVSRILFCSFLEQWKVLHFQWIWFEWVVAFRFYKN